MWSVPTPDACDTHTLVLVLAMLCMQLLAPHDLRCLVHMPCIPNVSVLRSLCYDNDSDVYYKCKARIVLLQMFKAIDAYPVSVCTWCN